jgi:DNA-binding CsgD family transcriptional regulator
MSTTPDEGCTLASKRKKSSDEGNRTCRSQPAKKRKSIPPLPTGIAYRTNVSTITKEEFERWFENYFDPSKMNAQPLNTQPGVAISDPDPGAVNLSQTDERDEHHFRAAESTCEGMKDAHAEQPLSLSLLSAVCTGPVTQTTFEACTSNNSSASGSDSTCSTVLKRHYPRLQKKWSAAEEDMLMGMKHQGLPTTEIAAKLGRGVGSVVKHARLMITKGKLSATITEGGKPISRPKAWTEDEDSILIDMKQRCVAESNIAAHLGRGLASVNSRARQLRKTGDFRSVQTERKAWTAEEESILLDLKGQGIPDADIGTQLGRSITSVRSHVKDMRHAGKCVLAQKVCYRPWTLDEETLLIEMKLTGARESEIATRLDRGRMSVNSHVKRMRKQMRLS